MLHRGSFFSREHVCVAIHAPPAPSQRAGVQRETDYPTPALIIPHRRRRWWWRLDLARHSLIAAREHQSTKTVPTRARSIKPRANTSAASGRLLAETRSCTAVRPSVAFNKTSSVQPGVTITCRTAKTCLGYILLRTRAVSTAKVSGIC